MEGRDVEQRVADLLELAALDTLYADLYVQRARQLLEGELGPKEYAGSNLLVAERHSLPNQIQNALDGGDWPRVRQLTERLRTVSRYFADRAGLLALAQKVYEPDVSLDPFSPGFERLTRFAGLPAGELFSRAVQRLDALAEDGPKWRRLCAARQSALRKAQTPSGQQPAGAVGPGPDLRQEAESALHRGDLDAFESLTERLAAARPGPDSAAGAREQATNPRRVPDLAYSFPPEVMARAERLGLVAEHADSMRDLVGAGVGRPAFHAEGVRRAGPTRLHEMTEQRPDAFRERVEFIRTHAFANSAGVRLAPFFVDEDVLVEAFDDPKAGEEPPPSSLVRALGLATRRGLSRRQIEHALWRYGDEIVEGELGLDPLAFRLVCIPSDLHIRLGAKRGWGDQESWTHLDGYMVKPAGELMPLVGGDVRFGGIFELVAVGYAYDSDRLVARFCLVQRPRMGWSL